MIQCAVEREHVKLLHVAQRDELQYLHGLERLEEFRDALGDVDVEQEDGDERLVEEEELVTQHEHRAQLLAHLGRRYVVERRLDFAHHWQLHLLKERLQLHDDLALLLARRRRQRGVHVHQRGVVELRQHLHELAQLQQRIERRQLLVRAAELVAQLLDQSTALANLGVVVLRQRLLKLQHGAELIGVCRTNNLRQARYLIIQFAHK